MSSLGEVRVSEARKAVTTFFLKEHMRGVECGAGSRPFPVPNDIEVRYGDLRDRESLFAYFDGMPTVGGDALFDAQTMEGFGKSSLDFILCGHVIEHLENPIGAILNQMEVLKPGGFLIHAVPDMRLTFDRERPETGVKHVLYDHQDGGAGTRYQAYWEHLKYVHPVLTGVTLADSEIERQATASVVRFKELDVHFHAWTMEGFTNLIKCVREMALFDLLLAFPIENENIFVIQKQ